MPRTLLNPILFALICISAGSIRPADAATGYVVSGPIVIEGKQGSVTPFDLKTGTFGAGFIVPDNGTALAVPPGREEIWQSTGEYTYTYSIRIYDFTGKSLGVIPFGYPLANPVFDSAGKSAFVLTNPAPFEFGLVKIDVATRTVVRTVPSVCTQYPYLTVAPDGSKVFTSGSCSNQTGVYVYDGNSLAQTTLLSVPASGVFTTGRYLIATGTSAIYYDLATLVALNSIPLPANTGVLGVSPSGATIFVASLANGVSSVSLIDARTGSVVLTQAFPETFSFVLSPDAKFILNQSDPVQVIDTQTLTVTSTAQGYGAPQGGAFAGNNTFLYYLYRAGAMMTVDQASAQITHVYPLGLTPLIGVVADPNRPYLYTGGSGRPAVVSETAQRVIGTLSFPGSFVPQAVSGTRVLGFNTGFNLEGCGSPFFGFPDFYDLEAQTVTSQGDPNYPDPFGEYEIGYGAAGVSPNQIQEWAPFFVYGTDNDEAHPQVVVCGSALNGLAAWSAVDGRLLGAIYLPTTNTLTAFAFSLDSSRIYTGRSGAIDVRDTQTFQVLTTFPYATEPLVLTMSPGGSTLYATNGTSIQAIDSITGTQIASYLLPYPIQGYMPISPDGSALWLLEANSDTLDLFSTSSGTVTRINLPYVPTGLAVTE